MTISHHIIMLASVCLLTEAAHAQTADPEKSDLETAEDVATQPVEDLNIGKKDIPQPLAEIAEKPYSLDGIRTCNNIRKAVNKLDDVLGDDLEVAQDDSKTEKRRKTASSLGKSLIGGIIPFRGVVREITGAAAQQRRYDQAVYAGVVRRSFLKGIGKERGCKFPAAPK